jgi:quercetin dioxygenase-like cupin family protein
MPRLIGLEAPSLISSARAAGNAGAERGQGDLVHIPGTEAKTSMFAEWYDPQGATGPYRIAGNQGSCERAPKDGSVSHYEAKLFNFPSGSIRVLTWKKGVPVRHLITFETEIFVLKGVATIEPLLGSKTKPIKIAEGDALFMPAGYITNLKPTADFVLLTYLVGPTKSDAKFSLVHAKDAPISKSVTWEENGKIITANEPKDMKRAPKVAIRQSARRYDFDGNSIRVATFSTGGRTRSFKISRTDVIIYVPQGRFRRKEGNQMLEVSAGDAIREKIGDEGWWEPLEENSVTIATDAPV